MSGAAVRVRRLRAVFRNGHTEVFEVEGRHVAVLKTDTSSISREDLREVRDVLGMSVVALPHGDELELLELVDDGDAADVADVPSGDDLRQGLRVGEG